MFIPNEQTRREKLYLNKILETSVVQNDCDRLAQRIFDDEWRTGRVSLLFPGLKQIGNDSKIFLTIGNVSKIFLTIGNDSKIFFTITNTKIMVIDHCRKALKSDTWSLISVNDWLSVFKTPKRVFVTVNSKTSRD